MKCGLLGRKLGHSYSPQIHALMADYPYTLFEKEPEEVGDFILHGDYTGINVTIPYKKDVIPFLDELSPLARRMGAVNTVVRRADGSLYGHNTDYFGFSSMLARSGIQVTGKKVLVLGSGGASNTAVKVLQDMHAQVIVISRSGPDNYSNLHRHYDASVIVNTTPVGMYPNTGTAPVDLHSFPALEGVLDMIYNPSRTQLMLDAEALGLPHENGLWMLVAQAKEAAEYFSGTAFDDSLIETVYNKLSAQMQNIVLIGMPGCGKSTIGALLADRLSRSFADADAKITELAGKSIPEIFAQDGETVFRQWETVALEQLGKQSGLVIATGGGCVTQQRNYPLLHQNSRIFWLQRSLDVLPTQGRPLSQANRLSDLYAQRKEFYASFADHQIDNNRSPESALEEILSALEESL
ncbi:MAG: shikimate kinase [Oscillospiraceae bacterium]|nr:shikimate kinase [Oscillospiraceae bacterium]